VAAAFDVVKAILPVDAAVALKRHFARFLSFFPTRPSLRPSHGVWATSETMRGARPPFVVHHQSVFSKTGVTEP